MPYRFIEEEATADVAFEAWGPDLGAVFRDAADALMNVMVDDLDSIAPRRQLEIRLNNEELDLLLYNFLEQLIYYKDSEQLLLRVRDAAVTNRGDGWEVRGAASGEPFDPARHHTLVDVKAVTLHEFRLTQTAGEWRAHVVLDI